MPICRQLIDGDITKINVEYHCKKCREVSVVNFWNGMTEDERNANKQLVEDLSCRECFLS